MPRPVHFEIHATDPERAIEFYTAVFGWKFERWGDVPYWVIDTGEGTGINGGLVPRQGPPPAADAPVHGFVNTIPVDDLDAVIATAESSGGTVALPKQYMPTVGHLAYYKDPDNNIFGILQPDPPANP